MNWRSTLERIGWTFVQAFVGALTAGPVADTLGLTFNVDALEAALVAGIAAVLVVVKDIAVRRIGALDGRLEQSRLEHDAAIVREARAAGAPQDGF